MAGLRELKKHLRSIRTTGQLAGAMKTVSSAKFSRANAALEKYRKYAQSCQTVMNQFASAFSAALPEPNPDAPAYYVVAASNRGLCGGYNSNLLLFAEDYLREQANENRCIITLGRMAQAHFSEHGTEITRSFILPDVPSYEDCRELFTLLCEAYTTGKASSVSFIYQNYKNTLTQTPDIRQILPLSTQEDASESEGENMLCIPDRATVTKSMCISMVNAVIFETVLQCAAGAQAATLIAMREACDNAEESGAALELKISRKRQSDVTASVIETFSVDSE